MLSPLTGCAKSSSRPPCSLSQLIRGVLLAGVTASTLPRTQPGHPPWQAVGLTGVGKFGSTKRVIQPSRYLSVATRRRANPSVRDTFNIKLPPRLKPPPLVPDPKALTEPSNRLNCGEWVTSFTVPPIEPEPYSVPCGPRNTSTRFRSYRSGSMTTFPTSAAAGAVRG